MSKPIELKQGDNFPLNGRVSVVVDGLDQSENEDFSQWSLSSDLVDPNGNKVLDIALAFVGSTGVFLGGITSAQSQSLAVNTIYSFDVRIRDALNEVGSTGTQQIKIVRAVSELPA